MSTKFDQAFLAFYHVWLPGLKRISQAQDDVHMPYSNAFQTFYLKHQTSIRDHRPFLGCPLSVGKITAASRYIVDS